jgi:hypothetical protein
MLGGYIEASRVFALLIRNGDQRLLPDMVICWQACAAPFGTLEPHISEGDAHSLMLHWYSLAVGEILAAADVACQYATKAL